MRREVVFQGVALHAFISQAPLPVCAAAPGPADDVQQFRLLTYYLVNREQDRYIILRISFLLWGASYYVRACVGW